MAWHTLAQAVALTARSRRSLYRDMDAGRVSYRVRADGRRELETSEMIRAYGPLPGMPEEVAQPLAQVGTLDRLVLEVRQLRELIEDLRQELRLIEHKPAPEEPAPVDEFADIFDSLRARH